MTDVSINLMWLRPGLTGGSENFAINLLKAIAEHKAPIRIEIVCPNKRFLRRTHFCPLNLKPRSRKSSRTASDELSQRILVFRNHRSSSMVHHMGGTAARTPSGT